ncbi:MAG: hypothetical protein D6768_09240 [Chloroflexi bacterium]|nr:MAG: hypothetical protein D6768_09240 [Chloroflexota bacterium]
MNNQNNFLDKWNPRVEKKWLYLLAGVMWSGVGVMLLSLAIGWLLPLNRQAAFLLGGMGILLGLIIYRFGFSKLAAKNERRIKSFAGQKICLFAFQEWKSYPLVAFMIALGITLRSSSLPKPYLAILYAGLGLGLFLSSLQYYKASQHRELS